MSVKLSLRTKKKISKGLKKAYKEGRRTGFKKGHTPWSKGKKGIHLSPESEFKKGHQLPEKTKKKISKALRGKPKPWLIGRTPWNKGKPHLAGEKHWNWKGGLTRKKRKIQTSREYKDWRLAVFKRDDYTCVLCGAKNKKGVRIKLHADHIKQFAYYPELRFVVSNGRTLCEDCHRKTPTYGNKASLN